MDKKNKYSRKIDNRITKDGQKTVAIKEHEYKKSLDYFIEICVKGAHQLRKYLKVGENSYKYVVGSAHSNTRDYYLYGILDEIEKAGLALLNCKDFILAGENEGKAEKSEDERIKRNIYSMNINQLSVWSRKLTEILVEVISFKKLSNEQIYFKHYLLSHELKRKIKIKHDFQIYHSCDSENLNYQISDLNQEIDFIIPKLDPSKTWYIRKNKNGNIGKSLSSFEDRLKLIFQALTPDQKLVIGDSYQSFSQISSNLHPAIGNFDYRVNMRNVDANFTHISMLAAHIVLVVKDMLGKKPRGFLGQLNRILKTNKYPRRLYHRRTNPTINIGDFVIAYSDLAEVIGIKKSTFGQKSFRVKFLDKPPLPTTPEDEFPAKYVKLYSKRLFLTRRVRDLIKKQTPDIKINNRAIAEAVRRTILHFWRDLGFKERAFGQNEIANKKLEEYLKLAKKKGENENKNSSFS